MGIKCVFYDKWSDIEIIQDPTTKALPSGTMFWMNFSTGKCSTHEPGCERHLMVVCPNTTGPNGHWWDIDSRASNCDQKQDKLHRCWVRHGEPPNITVNKAGLTCGAGGGSIMVDGYHGFLRNGEFTENDA